MKTFTFHIAGQPGIHTLKVQADTEGGARHKLKEARIGGQPLYRNITPKLIHKTKEK
jgi:hypothetical protein